MTQTPNARITDIVLREDGKAHIHVEPYKTDRPILTDCYLPVQAIRDIDGPYLQGLLVKVPEISLDNTTPLIGNIETEHGQLVGPCVFAVP